MAPKENELTWQQSQRTFSLITLPKGTWMTNAPAFFCAPTVSSQRCSARLPFTSASFLKNNHKVFKLHINVDNNPTLRALKRGTIISRKMKKLSPLLVCQCFPLTLHTHFFFLFFLNYVQLKADRLSENEEKTPGCVQTDCKGHLVKTNN